MPSERGQFITVSNLFSTACDIQKQQSVRINCCNMFMLNLAIVFGCVVTVLAQIDDANKLNCRICDNAKDLGDCKKLAVCDKTYEECYMDEVITAQLTIVYRSGCRAKDVCEGTAPANVGKKRREGDELIACSRCCNRNDTDGCNKRLCGIVSPGGNERQCYACSSDQSETIQGDVVDPADCVSFKTCQHDEVCFARSHVNAGKVSFEYGCHSNLTCQLLMGRMIEDKKRCDGGDVFACGTESLYCFTCCGWAGCNYGACKDQNSQIYELYKKGLFDQKSLMKLTSTATQAPTAQPTTPAPAPTTPPTTPAPAPTTPPTTPAPAPTTPPTPAPTAPPTTPAPAPTTPSTTHPAPTAPTSTQPAPTAPTSTQPAPTAPTSTQPAPTAPTGTQPAPTAPTGTQPAPTTTTTVGGATVTVAGG